ncbi:MFS transporter [Rhizobium sp. 16-449-1b]|uniref:MFS transporter n=1 Tax=Rhizobium sp. 16-449-1b TaxID=2819989 RepID=UPI001ADA37AD|nr:MFS transporter [Rhizobium sp. 16-449-1b]MBO9198599.1 MFS transporter [Rhizobium sp. 16-449-1b]
MSDTPEMLSSRTSSDQGVSRQLVLTMSVATGFAVASQYYNQPILGLIAQEFSVDTRVSIVATATQVGYAIGLILLVPLGDRMDRRKLIQLQCIGLMLAMAAATVAPGLAILALASVLIGVFATIAQQLIPFAAELATPTARDRVLGTLTSGLLIGVLLARTLSGFVGAYLGWRAMFALGAVIALLMQIALTRQLPRSRPESRESYGELLLSLVRLTRQSAVLQRAALTQSLLFFGFSAFWTILALLLRTPAFNLGSEVAGLFGLLALAGVVLAPPIVKLAGRRDPRNAVLFGAVLVALSYVVMIVLVNLIGIAIGVVLMITGLQVALISNQTVVFNAAGGARGRFNTVFMAAQFAFGAVGSAAASAAWDAGGWPAVMLMSAVSGGLAIFMQLARKA